MLFSPAAHGLCTIDDRDFSSTKVQTYFFFLHVANSWKRLKGAKDLMNKTYGANDRARTGDSGLEGRGVTTTLHPQKGGGVATKPPRKQKQKKGTIQCISEMRKDRKKKGRQKIKYARSDGIKF